MSTTFLCTPQTSIVQTLSAQNSSKRIYVNLFHLGWFIHGQQGDIKDGASGGETHPIVLWRLSVLTNILA
jgi:hypothetical protein